MYGWFFDIIQPQSKIRIYHSHLKEAYSLDFDIARMMGHVVRFTNPGKQKSLHRFLFL